MKGGPSILLPIADWLQKKLPRYSLEPQHSVLNPLPTGMVYNKALVPAGALSVTVLKAAARSLSLSPGQTAVLDCSIERDSGELVSWYKQSPGDAPQFVLSHYHTNSSAANYGSGFSSERFTAGAKDPLTYQLMIRSVEWSDVAVYYCGAWISAHG